VQLVTMLAIVVAFPLLCLGFLLWMARLEDSLPAAVRKAERLPDPAPILAVPVVGVIAGGAAPAPAAEPIFVPVHMPAQRTEPVLGVAPRGDSEPAAAPGLA
jgi:hypothetical protein